METPVPRKSQLEWPNLPENLLLDIQKAAQQAGINGLAVVGGAVRDGLLKTSGKGSLESSKDLDLVVEGSASHLAAALQESLDPKRFTTVRVHDLYNTVEINIDGFPVDLATARIEKYAAPGHNPQITPCILEEDLLRRDFTINAMAIELSNMRLIDPHGGKAAIEKRELHFLHSKSVQDDPTRIIRAARYSARLLFVLTPDSLKQIQSTIRNWPWEWRHNDSWHIAPPALATRLRLELELLLTQEPWEKALSTLQSWGGFLLFDRGLQSDQNWNRRLRWASRMQIDLLTAFLIGAEDPEALAARLQLSKQQQLLITQNIEIHKFLSAFSVKNEYLSWPPSKWCNEIENANWHPDAVALSICNGIKIWRPLLKWWSRWRLIKSPISGKELIKQGWNSGPALGKELKRLRDKKLDKHLTQIK